MGSSMSHHSSNTPSTKSIPADALAEILLRVPPHPTCLARASLAGKGLRGVITSPDFLRTNFLPIGGSSNRVSAAAFDPMEPGWRVVDSRHGRVLLRSPDRLRFLVWEPMAGRRRYIDAPPPHHVEHYKFSNAALNVLYWTMAGVMGSQEGILSFELEAQRLYLIGQPAYIFDPEREHVQVMKVEDGKLGLVAACGLSLQLWGLVEYNGEGRERWLLDRETYLDADMAPPEPIFEDYYVIWILGVEGSIVFLRTEAGIFEVDLQTEEFKRLWDGNVIKTLYPYRSFYRQGSTI
ncbi:uncharacterized protein LOC111258458 [Setaria italica]|uniref:uncharacterized protein LOC111258458 n=1 Tax=Setaria italica TaxID=4555 RepID=UPI000646DEAC|nr:uncharacterized protein LOC111258458 [Setaria italica]